MGADIRGIGSNLITVIGADQLGGASHDVAPDHIEIGSFMALAGVTGGELRIKDTIPHDLRMIRSVFERLGLHNELEGREVIAPADLTRVAVALATQAEGSVLIHEWMFESRLLFTDNLTAMGADIVNCDPHR